MSHLPVAVLVAVLASLPAALLYGVYRWHLVTQGLRARLEAACVPVRLQTVDFRELEGMPAPVQRYLRAVLSEGQPLVTAVDVKHAGAFNLNESGERWRPFTSRQRVVTQRPGFMWDGRIAMVPGVAMHVHDAYVAGEGILHPALFGLIALGGDTGGDVARGELMRFFAEAAWYPTALLPSQGVRWEPVDDRSAKATLMDGALSLTMLFRFGDDGLIDSVQAEARGRAGAARSFPRPGRHAARTTTRGMACACRSLAKRLGFCPRDARFTGAVISEIVYELTR
jgi:hypothetical protein